jgi:hypothetical protein
MIWKDGWKCKFTFVDVGRLLTILNSDFLLATCDVEGNFLVVRVSGPCMLTLHPLGSHLTGLSIHGSVIMHASQLASLLSSYTSLDDLDGNADGQFQFVSFSPGSTCDLNTTGHKSS